MQFCVRYAELRFRYLRMRAVRCGNAPKLEQIFATEIMGPTGRLRRCRLVEEAFGMVDDLDFDPIMDERTEKQQKSVDRARAQSHLILRSRIAELAKLRKGRFLCEQSQNNSQPAPGPAPASGTPAGFRFDAMSRRFDDMKDLWGAELHRHHGRYAHHPWDTP